MPTGKTAVTSVPSLMTGSLSPSSSPRPTSPGCCTWGTCLTTPFRTSSSAKRGSTAKMPVGYPAPTTLQYRHRSKSGDTGSAMRKILRKGDISRDEFMGYAFEWKDKYGGIILAATAQTGRFLRLGAHFRFTMDPRAFLPRPSSRMFVDLYRKGKHLSRLRMTNWDPEAKTVLSNEEVIYHEENARCFTSNTHFGRRPDAGHRHCYPTP
jgi:hypothetical protein